MSPPPALTVSRLRPGLSETAATAETPGMPAISASALAASVSAVTVISSGEASRASRASGASKATSLPCEMISILLHMACTSERMCEDMSTVRLSPSWPMSARISSIWMGSRPTVGSSSITVSGSPSRAWAMPTRWR